MSEKKLRLEIVTPQRKVFSEDVNFLVAPGSQGELGILPDHAPLITSLNIGIMRIEQDGQKFKVVSGTSWKYATTGQPFGKFCRKS